MVSEVWEWAMNSESEAQISGVCFMVCLINSGHSLIQRFDLMMLGRESVTTGGPCFRGLCRGQGLTVQVLVLAGHTASEDKWPWALWQRPGEGWGEEMATGRKNWPPAWLLVLFFPLSVQ